MYSLTTIQIKEAHTTTRNGLEKIMTANEFTRVTWKNMQHKTSVYFWGMHFDVSESFRHIDAHGALMDAPERMPSGGSSFRGLHMDAGPVCR